MFEKILVANRGEIACRVLKTAKRMGIATVAVYSEEDHNALHVRMADEAVLIGAAPASESYLKIEAIIDACQKTGAQAVHPGYGFLSERKDFAEALEAIGIAFIGPPSAAIEAMGDKITSKKLAQEAGVSTVPGYMGLVRDEAHVVEIATEIGYPVMIKASAGGGGKGMRIAWDDEEAREGYARSKSEAANSFGDDRIFVEKFIVEPRHIEIQIIGDKEGHFLYLNERECSIQRRNQKVIEEAPSPFLDGETRAKMGAQSVALAAAVGYHSAGTVEFIVDKDRNFYFLEMNTRLQVEHPVTELSMRINGRPFDLVEMMIRVAAGEKIDATQEDVTIDGWAIESRVYAENPYRNFLPSTGRLTRYRPPEERQDTEMSVRNDTGVYEGGEVSIHYDPMIAKLCTAGPSRGEAIAAMCDQLDLFELEGIAHNLPFLSAVMRHPRFVSGEVSTAFIAEEYPDGFSGVTLERGRILQLASYAAARMYERRRRMGSIGDQGPVFGKSSIKGSGIRPFRVEIAGDRFDANVHAQYGTSCEPQHAEFTVEIEDRAYSFTLDLRPQKPLQMMTMYHGDQPVCFALKSDPVIGGFRLRHGGADLIAKVYTPLAAAFADLMPIKPPEDLSKFLLCPMPGLVVRLMVHEGDQVEEGQPLAIIEAMKMENVLRAEKTSKIKKIPVSEGDSLAVDAVIIEFES